MPSVSNDACIRCTYMYVTYKAEARRKKKKDIDRSARVSEIGKFQDNAPIWKLVIVKDELLMVR